MAKDDWYFAISTVLAILALLGMDWKMVKGRFPVPQLSRHNVFFATLIILSLLMSGLGWYYSRTQFEFSSDDRAFIEIRHHNFVNEVVLLDKHRYIDCTFTNVTFQYNGTSMAEMEHVTLMGTAQIKTNNNTVFATTALLKAMGLLSPNFPLMVGPNRIPLR
jgi:hypothetical protein